MVGKSSNQPLIESEMQVNQEILDGPKKITAFEDQNQTEKESPDHAPINQLSGENLNSNRDWYDWVDLIAKVSIPLTILVVGLLFSSQQTSNQLIKKDRQM